MSMVLRASERFFVKLTSRAISVMAEACAARALFVWFCTKPMVLYTVVILERERRIGTVW